MRVSLVIVRSAHKQDGPRQTGANPRTDFGVMTMKTLFARFAKDESGATAIEYGLIAAGIAGVIIVIVNTIGSRINTSLTTLNGRITQ